MADIIRFVEDLIEKGYAYESQGDVYFRVEKSHNYAKLANKTLEDLELGASGRTDEETARKENPVDFALGKLQNQVRFLGTVLGDLVVQAGISSVRLCRQRFWAIPLISTVVEPIWSFRIIPMKLPSQKLKQVRLFANYWMHNGFVNIDNVKMSKSLGNFITVHDALKTIDGQVLRFFFATQHYRKPINFTEKAVRDAETNLKYLKNTYEQPISGTVDIQDLQAF